MACWISGVKPALVSVDSATAWDSLTTSGTNTLHFPDEVTNVTDVPEATLVPAAGNVLTTLPTGTVEEHDVDVVEDTFRPT